MADGAAENGNNGNAARAPGTYGARPRALVTGGAGFIGSHLSELLLADGWEVFALDDLSTSSIKNVAHLKERWDYHLVVDSVLSPSVVNELVHKCDVVFHLAAAVGVRLIVEQPVRTLVTNVQGTEIVARQLQPVREAGADRVDVGGVRRPPRREAARGGRAADLRPDDGSPVGVRGLEGDGRVSRARVPPGARPRLRDRPSFQHGRPAPERPVRDGCSALYPAAPLPDGRWRSTETGRRRAASATCRTRSALSRA